VRLGSPREPVWLEMVDGSAWLTGVHDPLAAEGYGRKRAQVAARIGAYLANPAAAERAVAEEGDLPYESLARAVLRWRAGPEIDIPFQAEMRADMEATVWLARGTVLAWREVELDDGTPAPCEPVRIEQALRELPGAVTSFRNGYFGALALWTVEKKGSGTSPGGTGTAEGGSASTASTTSPAAAPAASAAPTSHADRAARKAPRSGRSSARAPAPSAAPNGTAG
jgi:hypothetical protein